MLVLSDVIVKVVRLVVFVRMVDFVVLAFQVCVLVMSDMVLLFSASVHPPPPVG